MKITNIYDKQLQAIEEAEMKVRVAKYNLKGILNFSKPVSCSPVVQYLSVGCGQNNVRVQNQIFGNKTCLGMV